LGYAPQTHFCREGSRIVRWTERELSHRVLRPAGVLPLTPYSSDLEPKAATPNPSAARPRFRSSRTAAARLGIRVLYRKSSKRINSLPVSMICRRSPRIPSAMHTSLSKSHHMSTLLITSRLFKWFINSQIGQRFQMAKKANSRSLHKRICLTRCPGQHKSWLQRNRIDARGVCRSVGVMKPELIELKTFAPLLCSRCGHVMRL